MYIKGETNNDRFPTLPLDFRLKSGENTSSNKICFIYLYYKTKYNTHVDWTGS